jgi:glycosyltransferase involved in cell wall biosynthesis
MNFTFGIVTVKGNEKLLKKTIKSIEKLNIPNYEIYIIG